MTKVEALKRLLAALKDDGTTIDQISGDNVVDVLKEMIRHYGGDTGEEAEGVLGTLTFSSLPGTGSGTTQITVSGNSTNNFRYKSGAAVTLPEYGEDLSSWATWDGTSEITIADGTKICIAEVDSSNKAIAAGTTVVFSNE